MRPSRRATALAAAALILTPVLAHAAPASQSARNPWLERRVLNIAHQGGEIEAPSNTMYALKTAQAKGAEVLEIDVHATKDRELVVIHDETVNRTTNGKGRVDALTLAQIQQLDAAHSFVEGCGTCHGKPDGEYGLRGYATGERKLNGRLKDFAPSDFTVPTLREVLETFPDELINIEIKSTAPRTSPYEELLADLLAEFGRTDDTIVVSFLDHAMEAFKVHAPDVHTATATAQAAAFWASSQGPLPGSPNPRYQALQVPIQLNGVTVVTKDFVDDAHANGLAVHVWTINDVEQMKALIEMGVDGIMTDRPAVLEELLTAGAKSKKG